MRRLIPLSLGLLLAASACETEPPTSPQEAQFARKTVEEANVFEVNRWEPHPCTGENVHVSGTLTSRYTVWDSGLELNVYHSNLVGVDTNGTQYRYVQVGASVQGTPGVHTNVHRFISAGPGGNHHFSFHFTYNANGDLVVNNVTGECSG